jgi:hypothetical protein
MRMGIRPEGGTRRAAQLLAPLLFLGVLFLACWAASTILSGDSIPFAYAGLILAAGLVVLVTLKDWRRGVYLFLGWLLFEDLARKYLGNNMAVYFGKDLLAAVVYISFLAAVRRREVRIVRPPFSMPLLVFMWFGVLQVFNFASGSIFFGLLGLKLYFYYVPMFFVGYALFESETDLRRFYSFNALLALVIGGLGIFQSILGPTFLNPTVLQEDIRGLSTLYRTAPISGVSAYRANAVFVGAGRYADFLLLSSLIIFGFSGYLLLRYRKGRILSFTALGVLTTAAVMSASRGPFMWVGGSLMVGSAAFLWGAPWRQREALKIIRAIPRVLLVVGLALAGLIYAYPEAVGSRFAIYSETLMPDSPTSELAHRTWYYPLDNFLKAFQYPRWPYGYGIGTASLGLQYVARILKIPSMNIGVESGYGNLIVELGIVGLFLWLVWTVAVVLSAWRVVKKLRGTPWFPLGFMIFFYASLLLIPMSFVSFVAYQDFLLNAYLWLLLGILFRLPDFVLSAQAAETAVQAAGQRRT